MADNDVQSLLRTGIRAARAGDKPRARRIFERVLETDDGNELAWMWMASVVETPAERRICLENVLDIDPANERAQKALARMEARQAATPAKATPKPPAPTPEPAPRSEAPTGESLDWKSRLDAALPPSQRKAPAPKPARSRRAPAPAFTPKEVRAYRVLRGRRTFVILALMTLAILVVVAAAAVLIVLVEREGETETGETSTFPSALTGPTNVVVTLSGEESAGLPPTREPSPTPTLQPTHTPSPTPLPLSSYSLAYSARVSGQRNESIYTIRADGAEDEALRLTDDAGKDLDPAVSPDGQQIVFVSDRTGNPELYLIRADGTGGIILTNLGASQMESPSWSPDGQRIAFSAEFETNPDSEIYIISLSALNAPVQVTDNQAVDREPAWSPDGTTIAFSSDRLSRGYLQIYSVPADCTEQPDPCEAQVSLLNRSQNASMSPAWSPDGEHIAFVSNRDSVDDQDIYVMRANGTDAHRLTLGDYGGRGADDLSPAWSSDGEWIAFVSNREADQFQVYVMSPDGSSAPAVTSLAGNTASPSWFP